MICFETELCVAYAANECNKGLLQEAGLTFERVLKIAQTTETAENDSTQLQVTDKPISRRQSKSYKQHPRRGRRPQERGRQAFEKTCYRCGGKHSAAQCKFSASSVTRRGTLPQFVAKEKTYLKKAQKQF